MKTTNEYSIKIEKINSDLTTYRLCKNGQDIPPYYLTVEDMKIFQKELLAFSEMFKERIKYLEKL